MNVYEATIVYSDGVQAAGWAAGEAGVLGNCGICVAADARMALLEVVNKPDARRYPS
jgi:hypothetical protein